MTYENVYQIRETLKNASGYERSQSWAKKVDKMPDNQIIAIWISFKKRGLIK